MKEVVKSPIFRVGDKVKFKKEMVIALSLSLEEMLVDKIHIVSYVEPHEYGSCWFDKDNGFCQSCEHFSKCGIEGKAMYGKFFVSQLVTLEKTGERYDASFFKKISQ